MPGQFCHSCTAPLDVPQFKSAAREYCVHCVDEDGKLLPRKMVQDGIAHWLRSWQGKITEAVAHERAGHFMKAMPAWASGGHAAPARKAAKPGRAKAKAGGRSKAKAKSKKTAPKAKSRGR